MFRQNNSIRRKNIIVKEITQVYKKKKQSMEEVPSLSIWKKWDDYKRIRNEVNQSIREEKNVVGNVSSKVSRISLRNSTDL